MRNLNEVMEIMLPIVLVAIVTSSLTTVSIQGFKKFLNIEISGVYSRMLTVLIALFWSWALIIYFGKGTWSDFIMSFIMTMLGATGIYEVLNNKRS